MPDLDRVYSDSLQGCCSVLRVCAALCCIVLQSVAVRCSALQCVALCCSMLQCVAVCCSVLQCIAVRDTPFVPCVRIHSCGRSFAHTKKTGLHLMCMGWLQLVGSLKS